MILIGALTPVNGVQGEDAKGNRAGVYKRGCLFMTYLKAFQRSIHDYTSCSNRDPSADHK